MGSAGTASGVHVQHLDVVPPGQLCYAAGGRIAGCNVDRPTPGTYA